MTFEDNLLFIPGTLDAIIKIPLHFYGAAVKMERIKG
jgi:hypothetical protein